MLTIERSSSLRLDVRERGDREIIKEILFALDVIVERSPLNSELSSYFTGRGGSVTLRPKPASSRQEKAARGIAHHRGHVVTTHLQSVLIAGTLIPYRSHGRFPKHPRSVAIRSVRFAKAIQANRAATLLVARRAYAFFPLVRVTPS